MSVRIEAHDSPIKVFIGRKKRVRPEVDWYFSERHHTFLRFLFHFFGILWEFKNLHKLKISVCTYMELNSIHNQFSSQLFIYLQYKGQNKAYDLCAKEMKIRTYVFLWGNKAGYRVLIAFVEKLNGWINSFIYSEMIELSAVKIFKSFFVIILQDSWQRFWRRSVA